MINRNNNTFLCTFKIYCLVPVIPEVLFFSETNIKARPGFLLNILCFMAPFIQVQLSVLLMFGWEKLMTFLAKIEILRGIYFGDLSCAGHPNLSRDKNGHILLLSDSNISFTNSSVC